MLRKAFGWGEGGGLALQFHALLSPVIWGFEWSASHPGRFGPRKGASCFHSVECCVESLEVVWVIRWEGRSFSSAESWSMVPVISSPWCGHSIDWTVAAAVDVQESCGVEFCLLFIACSGIVLSSTTTGINNIFFYCVFEASRWLYWILGDQFFVVQSTFISIMHHRQWVALTQLSIILYLKFLLVICHEGRRLIDHGTFYS